MNFKTPNTGNHEYTYGYEVIDVHVNTTSRKVWNTVFDVFRMYDCGFWVTHTGVVTHDHLLALREVMKIKNLMEHILTRPKGVLIVEENGMTIKCIPMDYDTTHEELVAAIEQLSKETSS